MRAIELKDTLKELIKQKLPTFIWGSPGIGKSSIVKQIADEENLNFIDLRLSLLDPTDLKGIPFFDNQNKEAIWAQPNFLPKDKNSSGILFLDEINTAPPSVQAAAYQLILDRKIGDYELPQNWAIVAAGNEQSDRGVVYKMPSPLSNRFVHLKLDINFEDWKVWAYRAGINSLIIAFLNYKEDFLFTFDNTLNQKAFATPRSWEYVSNILNSNIKGSALLEAINGTIGKKEALEFISFIKVVDKLPNIEAILNGKDIEFSKSSDVLFALISIITSQLKGASKEKIENAIKLALKMPSEFSVMFIKDMQQNGIELEDCENWEEWIEKFDYLLE